MPRNKQAGRPLPPLAACRHVRLPPDIVQLVPKGRLMSEVEWRGIGVQQSRGWVRFAVHQPEPHILMSRRPLDAAAIQARYQAAAAHPIGGY
ncbi:hypothetical protein CHLNCDRAFT_21447 [Chlorella variabilis]|uniref:Cyclin-dependent kinases regulatory subunit n=1 Tax=Chlorella variabilis TaxID=554065 RepID=E1ZAB4_CHLVA|nr:hypothetical protein CHLNCDRAFT_21447 [Chlorella variabilis]EFN57029.1 hypothetical protein CHLNCDRAFT_21447 [Chlorella variabilis]|eukprot:XP_005849131.1 hypothetical protein CHLNCDRAFT_21447 [Chlorella variabilis]